MRCRSRRRSVSAGAAKLPPPAGEPLVAPHPRGATGRPRRGHSRAAATDARPLAVRTVKAFLDQRHGRRYRVYNLCSEKTYDPARSAPVPIRPFARALRAQLLGLSPAHTPVSKTGRSQPRKPSQHGKGYSRAGPAGRIQPLVHVAAKPVEHRRSASTGNVRHIQDLDQSKPRETRQDRLRPNETDSMPKVTPPYHDKQRPARPAEVESDAAAPRRFDGRVRWMPFPDHHPPTLRQMRQFCYRLRRPNRSPHCRTQR